MCTYVEMRHAGTYETYVVDADRNVFNGIQCEVARPDPAVVSAG